MLKKISLILHLLLLVVFVSCLPQEKTTQCGSTEAFDATQRRCVATLSSSTDTLSISSLTPTSSYVVSSNDAAYTHSITVSDPFNLGYSVQWNLTQSNGTRTTVSTGLNYTFIHKSFDPGTYILEVQLYNEAGTTALDARSWTINVVDSTTPTITPTTVSPFSTSTGGSAVTVSATATNKDLIKSVNADWYVNGSKITASSTTFSTATQALSFSFDPTSGSGYSVGAGVYSLQLVLSENVTNLQYSSYTWTIQNNIPAFLQVGLGTANAGTAATNTTPNTATTITVLDATSVATGGFKSGATDIDFCITPQNSTSLTGVQGDGVVLDFLENGVAIAGATNIAITTFGTSYCLGDALSTYNIDIPSNISAESKTLTAVIYDKYAGTTTQPRYNGGNEITRYTWNLQVRQLNTPPTITIDTANTNAPCTTVSTTEMNACTITQDASYTFALTVTDDDYANTQYTKFKVNFFLDGSGLTGVHTLSASDCVHDETVNAATKYICTLAINSFDTNGPIDPTGKTYTVTATVNDIDSTYTTDDSSDSNTVKWTIGTVNASATNATPVAFTETVAVGNSYVTTQAVTGTALSVDANADTDVGGNSADVTEGTAIIFHTAVSDTERDSYKVKLFRCDVYNAGSNDCTTSTLLSTTTVTSTDNSQVKTSQIAHTVSESAVVGARYKAVYYKISVRDFTTDTIEQNYTITRISVQNSNPYPVLTAGNFSPTLNTVGTPKVVYAGVPFTIDPGAVTDASSSDGSTIKYQWMISTDAGGTYTAISGATSRVLNWSPGTEIDFPNDGTAKDGTAVQIKLCVGDEGWDNTAGITRTPTAANCFVDSTAWFFSVFSNMQVGQSYAQNQTNNVSNGQVAVWIDPSAKSTYMTKYMAYATKANQIVVEKIVTELATGVSKGSTETLPAEAPATNTEEVSSIIFNASSGVTTSITNLSMTGNADSTKGALYISYMADVGGVDKIHVRRIDISTGKTGFTDQRKFGYDPGYNDLTDNITAGAGLTGAMGGAAPFEGKYQITVTASAQAQPTMNLIFSGLNNSTLAAKTFTAGTEFCAPVTDCTTTATTATAIRDLINASTEKQIQGFTAEVAGSVVTLRGINQNDFIEADYGVYSIGDIMINKTSTLAVSPVNASTGRWMIPFIDSDLSSTNKNKISLLHGLIENTVVDNGFGIRLSESVATKTADTTNTTQSTEVANDIYESDPDADGGAATGNDNILIATKDSATGKIYVYEYDKDFAFVESNLTIFTGTSMSKIDLSISQNATNTNAYLIARNDAGAIAYARIPHATGDFTLASPAVAENIDNSFALIANNNANNFDIAAGGENNVSYLATVDVGNEKAYLLKISGTSAVIDCSYASDQNLTKCQPLAKKTSVVEKAFDLPIALGDILEGVTIGTVGATTSENVVNILPLSVHIDDGGGNSTDDAVPISGFLNVSPITTSGDGTGAGNQYNLPYVNN